jgi:cytochrome P450
MGKLPPGPRGVLLNTLRYLRDPYESMLAVSRRYGDPYTSPSVMGRMIVTGDPAGIRAIFTADPDTYLALGAELLRPVLGESNLILLDGERHRAMRRLQTPPFHGARMRAYGQLIQDVAREHAGRWPRGRPFSLHRSMQEISLEVILRAVLGLTDPDGRAEFQRAVLSTIGALRPSFMFIPALRRPMLGLSAWARFLRQRERLGSIFHRELARRRAAAGTGEDILSLFLDARYEDGSRLDDEDLLIQMMNLIAAGHETTASSLAWAADFVHRDPQVRRRLVEGIRDQPRPLDPEAVARLPYLGAVCAETLRLNPVAPMIGRTLARGMSLLGYELPAGVSVGVAVLLAHRRPEVYPEPDRFQPERFLGRSYTPFEYLPFGGGARRCLGAAFAEYEMKLVLATVLAEHDLELASDAPPRPEVRNTTIGPGGGVPMLRR